MRSGCIVLLAVAGLATWAGAALPTEDFENLPSSPTWKAPEDNWIFGSSIAGGTTSNTANIGTVQSGGPVGKYGNLVVNDDQGAILAVPGANISDGTWSFLMNIHNPATDLVPSDANARSGQVILNIGSSVHDNGGPDQKRPDIVLNVLDPGAFGNVNGGVSKLRLQFQRGGTNPNPTIFADDRSTLLPDTWYQYDFNYNLTSTTTWDLTVKDLSGNTLISELGNSAAQLGFANFAHWYKRAGDDVNTGIGDGALSADFSIDQVNLGVPEPSGILLAGGIACMASLRRRRSK
jgi:hypothetical protein